MQQTTPRLKNMRIGAAAVTLEEGAGCGLRAIVIDKVDERLTRALRAEGVEVTESPGIARTQLLGEIPLYDMLVGRTRMPIDAEMMERGVNLRIIARAAVGIDNIDVDEAQRRGIQVINAPGAATDSVAELTMTLTQMALRKAYLAAATLEGGEFAKMAGAELGGKVVGIIGLGRIGSRFAQLLAPYHVKILATDLVEMNGRATDVGARYVSKDELLAQADIVSLHVNMEANRSPVIDNTALAKMKLGAILVNTVRAAAVDIDALYVALTEGKIAGYAADVLLNEPPKLKVERDLIALPNTVITPHMGAQTPEAQSRVANELVPALLGAMRDLAQ